MKPIEVFTDNNSRISLKASYWKHALLIFMVFSTSCVGTTGNRYLTKPVEKINPTADQAKRRKESEDYCAAHKIPVYSGKTSLFTDPEESIKLRTKDAVVDRALALYYCGLKSEGRDKNELATFYRKYNVGTKLSSKEQQFTDAAAPTNQQNIDAGWKYEDLHVMLWALGYIDNLTYADRECNVTDDTKLMVRLTEQQFRHKAKFRSKKEIADQADLILRIDWACVDARVNQKPTPGNLLPGVVFERHYALNWLISFSGEEWDNVTTDT